MEVVGKYVIQLTAGLVQGLTERHANPFQMRVQALAFGLGEGGEEMVLSRVVRGRHGRSSNHRSLQLARLERGGVA